MIEKDISKELAKAAENRNMQKSRKLLEAGADPNTVDTLGRSTLIYLSVWGYADLIKLFIDFGADIEITDGNSRTPLISAAVYGNAEIVRLLLDCGADLTKKDNSGATALICAAGARHISTVQVLLEYKTDINWQDNIGHTALMTACSWGYTEIAKLLLEHNANVNLVNNNGDTALNLICSGFGFKGAKRAENIIGRKNIIEMLLETGTDSNTHDKDGITPLISLAYGGQCDLMKILITAGADINIRNNEGQAALDILKKYHPKKYKKLIEYMARKDQLNTEDSLTGPVQDIDWNI